MDLKKIIKEKDTTDIFKFGDDIFIIKAYNGLFLIELC